MSMVEWTYERVWFRESLNNKYGPGKVNLKNEFSVEGEIVKDEPEEHGMMVQYVNPENHLMGTGRTHR